MTLSRAVSMAAMTSSMWTGARFTMCRRQSTTGLSIPILGGTTAPAPGAARGGAPGVPHTWRSMAYLPNTDAERRSMLDAVGAERIEDLFSSVPAQLLDPRLDLPPALSEQELVADLERLAARNRPLSAWESFLGAGVYRRFVPAIVRATISRPEFYTAYTPYQAEASQGTLQTIFEFQTMICALTGMDVANASLYDGATATAEAMVMAVQATHRTRVKVAFPIHPEILRVLRTFGAGRRIDIEVIDGVDGVAGVDRVAASLSDEDAALIAQHPS